MRLTVVHKALRAPLHLLGTAALVAAAAFASTAAAAQNFPSRPVNLVVPFNPGGATDVQMRALGTAAEKILKQPVVIINTPGVGGTLGPANMARSAQPDGYTVSVVPASLFRLPHIQKVTYDPVKDFTYIIGLTKYAYGIVVPKDAPWKSLQDLIDDAGSREKPMSYATVGVGTSGHIVTERFARAAGIQLSAVPFKGGVEVIQATIGRHVDFMSDAGWGSAVDNGQLRLLAVAENKRIALYPDVPTLKELGYDITANSVVGIAGPAGMDPAVVKILHDAFLEAARTPEFQRSLEVQGQPFEHMDSATYTRFAAAQTASDKRFVEELGIKLE
jgi:tripartite-type tricarboxylate transporter receptor subunit TctC